MATDESVLKYVKSLLEERRNQLQALEQRTPGHTSDHLSCRRSLEQAIHDLEIVLRDAKQAAESEGLYALPDR